MVGNPLWKPYRTGSYLIYDVPAGKEHESRPFRSAPSGKLPDHRYRASGSHQLNLTEFASVLGKVVDEHAPSTIYLVDLREATHGFFDLHHLRKVFGKLDLTSRAQLASALRELDASPLTGSP